MADPLPLLAAALVIFGAAFVQGVTGFAHALLAIGLLSLIFGSKEAVLMLTLLGPLITVGVFWRHRKSVVWSEVLALALPLIAIGLPLGILLFGTIDEGDLTVGVGAFLIVSAGFFLTPWAPRPRKLPLWFSIVPGIASGFINGVASTGGPPLVLYLYAREMKKEVRLAILQAVFVLGNGIKIVIIAPKGWFTGPILVHSAILAVPMLAGVFVGQLLFDRLPADAIKKAALILLVAIGGVLVAT